MLSVDAERCTGCGSCVDVCPSGAIYLVEGIATIDTERCDVCGLCADACPHDAILRTDAVVLAPTIRPHVPVQPEVVQRPSLPVVVWPWVSAALAFAAHEIAPRVAHQLLAAWDRRASRPTPTDLTLREHPPLAATSAGHRRRQRHRGGNRSSA